MEINILLLAARGMNAAWRLMILCFVHKQDTERHTWMRTIPMLRPCGDLKKAWLQNCKRSKRLRQRWLEIVNLRGVDFLKRSLFAFNHRKQALNFSCFIVDAVREDLRLRGLAIIFCIIINLSCKQDSYVEAAATRTVPCDHCRWTILDQSFLEVLVIWLMMQTTIRPAYIHCIRNCKPSSRPSHVSKSEQVRATWLLMIMKICVFLKK